MRISIMFFLRRIYIMDMATEQQGVQGSSGEYKYSMFDRSDSSSYNLVVCRKSMEAMHS